MHEAILSVRNLSTYLELEGKPCAVVNNLSFDLHLGKTLALVGESGCGKTMVALSLMRILPQPPAIRSTGQLLYRGRNLLEISEREMRRLRGGKIAMIFQDPGAALNPVYTISDQLMEAVGLHRQLYGEEAYELAVEALKEVGISAARERMDDYPHQLSGGMKQRVMIAMALIGEPEILIADEPTTALDVTIQAQVLELIRHLQQQKEMALLLITHDIGVVAEMADEVIVMYASESMESGSVLDIFDRHAHPYAQGLFNSLADLAEPGQPLKPIKGTVPAPTNYPTGCKFQTRCPFKMDKCCHGKIPNFAIDKDQQHVARCLLYDGTEESEAKKSR